MQIITKARKLVRSLSSEERSLLARYCEQQLSGQDNERASRLLRSIRHDDQWLACDCVQNAPVMNIALLDSGTLVLRNNPGTDNHADTCAFGRSTLRDLSRNRAAEARPSRLDHSASIALHAEFARGSGAGNTSPAAGPAISKKPVLSLLLTLCDDAGLNVYNPAAPLSLTEQFARIREISMRYTLSHRVPLSTAMDTKIDMPRMIRLGKRLMGIGKDGARSIGVLFDRVKTAKGRKLLLTDDKEIGFFGHVERYGPVSDPMLAMATVTTQRLGASFYELGHVALVPSVSERHLFPVGTAFERTVVGELFGLADWMHKKGTTVIIQRHLFTDPSEPALMIKGRDRVLSIILDESPPGEDRPPLDDDSILRVRLDEDLKVMKRRIAAKLMPVNRSGQLNE